MAYGSWPKYVSVAQRRTKAAKSMQRLEKKGLIIEPIKTEGRKIACTFWGEAWCDHLEKFSDYENRLPRGRTYVRNGSVCHLAISKGRVEAIVSGSELYNIKIDIKPLSAKKWDKVREQCAGQIGSMLELLQGHFSDNVMKIVTDQGSGLFPQPSEITLTCDCPDWAEMCKHIAAVLYGVGSRLDHQPELLFLLRNVDHEALIAAELDVSSATSGKSKGRRLATTDLSDLFGVEMDEAKPTHEKIGHKKESVNKKTVKKRTGNTLKKQRASKGKNKPFTATAAAVRRLRKRFKMNVIQFSELLGITPATINKWENSRGKLTLRQHTLAALSQAIELTAEQAIRKLKKIERQKKP
ncbi:MAG: helix-turn-helix domain-containing protein [Thiotrichaceae bacterium]|nr:helix-turn-helix domain-containing protein [Thiotrichaceae bacterium]